MRKKEFFTKLDSELQSAAPTLSDDLKSMPITVSSESPIVEEDRSCDLWLRLPLWLYRCRQSR